MLDLVLPSHSLHQDWGGKWNSRPCLVCFCALCVIDQSALVLSGYLLLSPRYHVDIVLLQKRQHGPQGQKCMPQPFTKFILTALPVS